jgi:hypothetical protein
MILVIAYKRHLQFEFQIFMELNDMQLWIKDKLILIIAEVKLFQSIDSSLMLSNGHVKCQLLVFMIDTNNFWNGKCHNALQSIWQ